MFQIKQNKENIEKAHFGLPIYNSILQQLSGKNIDVESQ